MPEHGGKLLQAAEHYGIDLKHWLDLSTGINPNGWEPSKPIPSKVWNRLPENNDGLEQAAEDYYGSNSFILTAGSQAAIQLLPQVLKPAIRGKVGIIEPGYNEHSHAWRHTDYQVDSLRPEQIMQLDGRMLEAYQTLVIINPNNPSGHSFDPEYLLSLHHQLRQRKGYLIVDEAFIDSTPKQSLINKDMPEGLIVLRSLGKFFGLAGLRVGALFAEQKILSLMESSLGPWSIAHPSRHLAKLALSDTEWQTTTRHQLAAQSQRLNDLLSQHGLKPNGSAALFQWVQTTLAFDIHQQLAKQAVFTRYFEKPASLRFGLPGSEAQWDHLEIALSRLISAKSA